MPPPCAAIIRSPGCRASVPLSSSRDSAIVVSWARPTAFAMPCSRSRGSRAKKTGWSRTGMPVRASSAQTGSRRGSSSSAPGAAVPMTIPTCPVDRARRISATAASVCGSGMPARVANRSLPETAEIMLSLR